ncbi:MAG: transcriptional repressor [Treponema sp.]|jgi:Fur family peroxide stress response transcriptional regulator|nr:transcriptional repressor [Treponema sp.]
MSIKNRERKYSKKREAILRMIQSTQSHPSARWVYEQLKPAIPGLSLGTVYRNINLFIEEGSVVSIGIVDGEERFDGCIAPHPHLICTCCSSVFDLPGDFPLDSSLVSIELPDPEAPEITPLPGNQEQRIPGFFINYQKTLFYGVCSRCMHTLKLQHHAVSI